jgi:inorganic triphosphatase YgiF
LAREVEFKLLFAGPAELEALARAAEARGARQGPCVLQHNHFIDTPDGALRRGGGLLRLRAEGGRWTLAAKGPGEQQGELHRRTELEIEVAPGVAAGLLAGELDALAELERGLGPSALLAQLSRARGARRLGLVGGFDNERTRVGPLACPGAGPLWLELDRTRLPGGETHHEIELEVPEGAEPAAARLLGELCAAAGVRGRPAASKAARFFEALGPPAGRPADFSGSL